MVCVGSEEHSWNSLIARRPRREDLSLIFTFSSSNNLKASVLLGANSVSFSNLGMGTLRITTAFQCKKCQPIHMLLWSLQKQSQLWPKSALSLRSEVCCNPKRTWRVDAYVREVAHFPETGTRSPISMESTSS